MLKSLRLVWVMWPEGTALPKGSRFKKHKQGMNYWFSSTSAEKFLFGYHHNLQFCKL